ncbi:unnamed protein product [Ascophyllum nodosum]
MGQHWLEEISLALARSKVDSHTRYNWMIRGQKTLAISMSGLVLASPHVRTQRATNGCTLAIPGFMC